MLGTGREQHHSNITLLHYLLWSFSCGIRIILLTLKAPEALRSISSAASPRPEVKTSPESDMELQLFTPHLVFRVRMHIFQLV